MAKIQHTVTGCVPIDRSVIEAYATLVNTDKFIKIQEEEREEAEAAREAAESSRETAEGNRETVFAADHTTATQDHGIASADHTQATADHSVAVSDHGIASSDHTTASADHTQAVGDSERAATDHATASSDHGIAQSDHTTAASDHTTAASDHTTAASDHTTAASDHTNVQAALAEATLPFNVSEENASGGVPAEYASLEAILSSQSLGILIPVNRRYAGMTIKFINSTTSKYESYMFTGQSISSGFTTVANWQGVDDVPIADSKNVVMSGGVHKVTKQLDQKSFWLYTPKKELINSRGSNVYSAPFSTLYNKVVAGCKEMYIQTYCTNTARGVLKFWDNSGNVLGIIYGTSLELDSETGLLCGYVNVPDGAAYYVASQETDYSGNAEMYVIQYALTQNVPVNFVSSDSPNRLNPGTIVSGIILADGSISPSNSYYTSDYIEVFYGKTYLFKDDNWQDVNARRLVLFDGKGTVLSSTENIASFSVTKTTARFIRFSVERYYFPDAENIGVFENSESSFSFYGRDVQIPNNIPYDGKSDNSILIKKDTIQDHNDIQTLKADVNDIQGDIQEITDTLPPLNVNLSVSGNELLFSSDSNTLKCSTAYGGNEIFNFVQRKVNNVTSNLEDDVAPIHIALKEGGSATTIGANHGWNVLASAAIASHGKTNADIGTIWTDGNGKEFVLAKIVNANTIQFIPNNQGNRIDMDITTTTFSSLTRNGETLSVTSVSYTQLYKSVKNHVIKVMDANGKAISSDGNYESRYFDVVESYEIINLADIITNLINRQSMSPIPTTDPEFTGGGMIEVRNIYRFLANTSVVVMSSAKAMQKIYLNHGDMMFSQSQYLISGSTIQYYVPGSKPVGTYNLTRPISVSWSQSNPSFNANSNSQADASIPITRVIQYSNHYGFALGFLPYAGVGKNLLQFTGTTFELRGYSGKVYPHGVEGVTYGAELSEGETLSAILYRTNISLATRNTQRISYYSFDAPDGYTYLFADYSADCVDCIKLDDKFNGKPIEIVESSNCSLLADFYNDGVTVKATAVTDRTSYIVVKIATL